MADLRSTIDLIKKRKQAIDEAAGMSATPTTRPTPTTSQTADPDDLLSDAAIDAAVKRRKAAQKKSSWWNW